jgi:hypothetical protein
MLVQEYPNAVARELCAQIIACFERDPARKASAVIIDGKPQLHQFRTGTQLAISLDVPEWKELFMTIVPALRATMESYMAKHKGLADLVQYEGLDCTLPMIERVDAGQGFDWHYDGTKTTWKRVVAGLLYLNTINEGGQTEFSDGLLVQPECGKIVLFPPHWTHFHRGVTPIRETKYVMSYFWIYPD